MIVAFLALTWVVIALLCLGFGALLSQIRALERAMTGKTPLEVGPDPIPPSVEITPGTPSQLPTATILFITSTCSLCHDVLLDLSSKSLPSELLVVSDEAERLQPEMRRNERLRFIADPAALRRSGIHAVPWFVSTDDRGQPIDSFPVSNAKAVKRVLRTVSAAK